MGRAIWETLKPVDALLAFPHIWVMPRDVIHSPRSHVGDLQSSELILPLILSGTLLIYLLDPRACLSRSPLHKAW